MVKFGTLGRATRAARWVTIGLVIALFVSGLPAAHAEDISASTFVEKLADEAIGTLGDNNLSETDRKTAITAMMERYFDTRAIGKYVVGRHWEAATPAQQDAYLQAFGTYFVRVYADLLGGYSGETLTVIGEKALSERDALVAARIRNGETAIDTELRVRDGRKGQQIIDIMVNGVSMIATHRVEFSGVANREGFEGLIDILMKQTAKLEANG